MDCRTWGHEILDKIDGALWIKDRHLYANDTVVGQPVKDHPAFMWGCGVELSALAAAARIDRAYRPKLHDYFQSLEVYWQSSTVSGYDVLPVPKPLDRYYDDNAWVVLALVDAYDVTHDAAYLRRAQETFKFVMSGEDSMLGGGLYWHEQEKKSKNTCSNAPATVSALRLYQATKDPTYLETGKRLYAWTVQHLQDTDGLFFDNIRLDGSVEKTKWTYNTAVMLKATCLLYHITRDAAMLKEAERIASASVDHWVKPETGGVNDGGAFAHMLLEALLMVYDEDADARWTQTVSRALQFLHDSVRDANGFYGDNWSRPVTQPREKIELLNQASAARIFMFAARYPMAPPTADAQSGH